MEKWLRCKLQNVGTLLVHCWVYKVIDGLVNLRLKCMKESYDRRQQMAGGSRLQALTALWPKIT